MTSYALFGIVAGILSFLPCPFYIRSILKGKTRPDRVTWWILALVSGMIAASSWASGARETLWLPIGYALSFFIIAVFSVKYGDGPIQLHLLDRVCLSLAIFSIIVWWAFNSPLIALCMNIVVDFIGLIPTAHKAYVRPWTEDRTAWIIAVTASFLNLFAISEWTFAISAYPIYVFIFNALITYFILRRRFQW